MGVDYSAFVCWGQKVIGNRNKLMDAFERHVEVLQKHGVGYAEYGSHNYSGDGGFILTLDHTYHAVDFDDASLAKRLPNDRDWDRVDGTSRIQDVLYELRKRDIDIRGDGETGWFVCGHVY